MRNRVAIIGAAGQLGSDLLPLLGDAAIGLGHDRIEITSPESVASVLAAVEPDCVVNLAAYNLVDKAEEDRDAAFAVNADGPRHLAAWCESAGVPLLHVSTDYVFGRDTTCDTPYTEDCLPGPISVYGESKLAGEAAVRETCSRHWIVRTCGLYGHAALRGAGKGNFVETMLRLSETRDQLKVVDDQRCTPSATADVAVALAKLIATGAWGLYHVTNSGSMTWCELARAIFEHVGKAIDVAPITTEEFGAPAARPRYSVLDCTRFTSVTGHELPSWQDALARYLDGRAPLIDGR